VLVCAGMTSRVMKSALFFSIPHNIPHVSRLRRVFADAAVRKCLRSGVGRKMVRSGAPFSKYAAGLKVNSSRSVVGVSARAVGGILPGKGGAEGALSTYLPGIGGGCGCCSESNLGVSCPGGFGGSAGGKAKGSYSGGRTSFGGRAGTWGCEYVPVCRCCWPWFGTEG
jgi:hypothetical protein